MTLALTQARRPVASVVDEADDAEVTTMDPGATAAAVARMSTPDAAEVARPKPPRPAAIVRLPLRVASANADASAEADANASANANANASTDVEPSDADASPELSNADRQSVTQEITLTDVVLPPPLPTRASTPARMRAAESGPARSLAALLVPLAAVAFFVAYASAAAFGWFVDAARRVPEIARRALSVLRVEWARASLRAARRKS